MLKTIGLFHHGSTRWFDELSDEEQIEAAAVVNIAFGDNDIRHLLPIPYSSYTYYDTQGRIKLTNPIDPGKRKAAQKANDRMRAYMLANPDIAKELANKQPA